METWLIIVCVIYIGSILYFGFSGVIEAIKDLKRRL